MIDILCGEIFNVKDIRALQQSMMNLARHYLVGLTHRFGERWGSPTQRDGTEVLPFNPSQQAALRLAQAQRLFE